jgi:chromosome segregation and condensation protein ScpB
LQHHLKPFEQEAFSSWVSRIFRAQKRQIEDGALVRLFELTEGVTEDLVATCAEIWVQDIYGRSVAPADVEVGWRNVVANAAQYFLPRVSALSGLQARFLRHVARNPRAQPFAEETLSAIRGESGPAYRALRKLIELELLREEQRDGRRRVWVHDARLAFYLRA